MLKKLFTSTLLIFTAVAYANTAYIKEAPGSVRFEQYAGVGGPLTMWRMPNPGSSLFPGTNCLNVAIQSVEKEKSSRFIAMYLFAKSSGDQIFYYIDRSTCQIVSFGIDG